MWLTPFARFGEQRLIVESVAQQGRLFDIDQDTAGCGRVLRRWCRPKDGDEFRGIVVALGVAVALKGGPALTEVAVGNIDKVLGFIPVIEHPPYPAFGAGEPRKTKLLLALQTG